jgi:hypothetical protein
MSQSELHLLYQQMGEVLSGIKALHETIEIRQAQTEQLQEMVRAELMVLRKDQRELDEKLECVVFVMQHDVSAVRSGTSDNTRSIGDLVVAVNALRRPISDIVALRSRVAGLIVGIGFVGSIMIWLAEPVYRWLIDTKVLRP